MNTENKTKLPVDKKKAIRRLIIGVVVLAVAGTAHYLRTSGPSADKIATAMCKQMNNDPSMPWQRQCQEAEVYSKKDQLVRVYTPAGRELWSYYNDGKKYWFNFETYED